MSTLEKTNILLIKVVLAVPWIIGIILAEGFWSTTFALFIPLWAWYLTTEKWLMINNWL